MRKKFESIGREVEDFRTFCNSEPIRERIIGEQCLERQKAIYAEFNSLKTSFNEIIDLKDVVSTGRMYIGGNLLRIRGKDLPQILITGAVTYIGYRDYSPTREAEQLRKKTARIAALTLNITKWEYDQIDKRIDIVSEQRYELMLNQRILDYASVCQILFDQI